MKKILPIIAIIGSTTLLTGCNQTSLNIKFKENIKSFHESLTKYEKVNASGLEKTIGRYKLSISSPEGATLVDTPATFDESGIILKKQDDKNLANVESIVEYSENIAEDINDNAEDELTTDNQNSDKFENNSNTDESITDENANTLVDDDKTNNNEMIDIKDDSSNEISTLYYLSEDIENSCDEFCDLKEDILDAIAETENLIEKLKNKEINLTREQRLFVNEQSNQLKNLSKQLSKITTELSFNLSDLNAIMELNNQDLDTLSLKYLIVLDSLINGNEMLQNGLSSLNLMNNMVNLSRSNGQNNKIIYGYQKNGEEPIIKNYYIDESNEIVENTLNSTDSNKNTANDNIETTEANAENSKNKGNIDTYKNSNLKSNIDTYGNNRQNIDTFFNTALLDNEFMYGNNGFAGGYGGFGYANPYMNQYYNYEQSNKNNLENATRNSVNNENTTQNDENVETKKKFKLKNNIDTYRDENTPDIKTKINNFKQAVSGFFKKFNVNPKDDIRNPIYRFNSKD